MNDANKKTWSFETAWIAARKTVTEGLDLNESDFRDAGAYQEYLKELVSFAGQMKADAKWSKR